MFSNSRTFGGAPSGFGIGANSTTGNTLGFNQNQSSGGFGQQNQGGFGQNQSTGGFGQQNQGGFGQNQSTGGFGQQNQGGFGQNQSAGGFGQQNQGGFGQNQSTGGFGQQNQGGFGQNQSSGVFGQNQGQGMFGGNKPAAGNTGSPFGQGQAGTGGGFGAGSSFGSTTANAGNTGFGGSSFSSFGSGGGAAGGFGSKATGSSAFGAQGQTQSGFGQQQTGSSFGASGSGFGQNQSSGGFGQNQSSGGFGQNQSSGGFGQNQSTGGFGQNQPSGGFGQNQSSGGFGLNQGQGMFGGNKPAAGNTGSPFGQGQAGTGVGFGAGSSFGSTTANAGNTGFGGSSFSSFGSGGGAAGGFGSKGTGSSAFGAQGQTQSGFGQQQTGSSFGASGSGFGQNQSSGGFGLNQGQGMFGGNKPAAGNTGSSFGQGQVGTGGGFGAGSSFGSTTANAGNTGFGGSSFSSFGSGGGAAGGFGSKGTGSSAFGAQGQTQSGFGQQQTGSSFGASGSGFGQNQSSGGFGSLSQTTGGLTTGGFGASKPGASSFGTSFGQGQGGFGSSGGTGGGFGAGSSFGSTTANAGSTGLLGQSQQMYSQAGQVNVMQQQQMMRAADMDSKYRALQARALQIKSDPRLDNNVPAEPSKDSGGELSSYRHAPRIVSRFGKNSSVYDDTRERPLSAIISPSSVGTEPSVLSPEALLGRHTKKLVINTQSPVSDVMSALPALDSDLDSEEQQLTPQKHSSSSSTSAKSQQPRESVTQPPALSSRGFGGRSLPVGDDFDGSEETKTNRDIPLFDPKPLRKSPSKAGQRGPRCDEFGPANPPILTRSGYYTSPDMRVLKDMSPEELASVYQFSVFRPNIGTIEWEGHTDIRNLNLDELVNIEKGMIGVYEGMSFPEKPEVGNGLNKPAVVTLYDIFPKANSTQAKYLQFSDKLKKTCEKNGSEFVDYNLDRGEWTFRVLHFSRYGLDDSESDDECGEPEQTSQQPVKKSVHFNGSNADMSAPTSSPRQKREHSPAVYRSPFSSSLNSDYTELGRIRRSLMQQGYDNSYLMEEDDEPSDVQAPRPSPGLLMHAAQPSTTLGNLSRKGVHVSHDTDPSPLQVVEYAPSKSELSYGLSAKVPRSFVFHGKSAIGRQWPAGDSPCMRLLQEVKSTQLQKLGVSISESDLNTFTTVGSVKYGVASVKKKPVDAALYLGRSFRVGWSASGKIIHPGKLALSKEKDGDAEVTRNIRVEKIDCLQWCKDTFPDQPPSYKTLAQVLTSIFSASSQNTVTEVGPELEASLESGDVPPLWSLARSKLSDMDEYLRFVRLLKDLGNFFPDNSLHEHYGQGDSESLPRHHPCWIISKIVSLVDACCGQESLFLERFRKGQESSVFNSHSSIMPLYEIASPRDGDNVSKMDMVMYDGDRDYESAASFWERRHECLARWLAAVAFDPNEGITAAELSDQDLEIDEVYTKIFQLLSSRRVSDAIEVAQSADLHRLSMLLCQLESDDDVTSLINDQLMQWFQYRANETISRDLLAVYRIIGGDVSENGYSESILSDMEWTNALGVIFWFANGSSGQLSQALSNFGKCYPHAPSPPYQTTSEKNIDDESPPYHALYSLLKVYFDTQSGGNESSAKLCLRPRGYTRDVLDYRGSYIILLMLEATGVLEKSEVTIQASIVRQHMVFQLLSQGMWQWAVFLCLQIEDPIVRTYAVRDIVLRYGGREKWEKNEDSSEFSLMTKFFISDRLLNEATAYRYGHTRHVEAEYLRCCGQWLSATRIVCRDLVPKALFDAPETEDLIKKLLYALEDSVGKANEDEWLDTGGALLSYFKLKENVEKLRSQYTKPNNISVEEASENEAPRMTSDEVIELSCSILQEALDLLKTLRRSNFGMCTNISDSDTVTKIAVHDIGTYLFEVITELSSTDYNYAQDVLTKPELALVPVLDTYRLQVCRRLNAQLGE